MKRPVTVIGFILVLVLFIALLTPRIFKVSELKKRNKDLDTELLELKKQNRLYEKELRLLREDPVYLEKVAREKFNKAKPGEIVYKVVKE